MADERTPEQIAYDEELARINAMPTSNADFISAKIKAENAFKQKYPQGRPGGDSEEGRAEALAFGLTDSLIKAFPELKPIYDLFVAKRYADARLAYYDTNYYKNLTKSGQERQTKKATQPGVYAQEFDAWKQAQKVRLTSKGIKLTPTIESMLEQSYLKGDTDLQVDLMVVNSGGVGQIGGSTLGVINALKQKAFDEGVNNLLSTSYWNKVSEGLFSGILTSEDISKEIEQTAMSAYPAYAAGIQAGKSFGLQTSALRQAVSNFLEIDVDAIGNDNPVFKKLTNWINPSTGKQEAIPLWEAEKIVKSQPDWLYTKNAQATFDTLGFKVLRDYGVI